MKTKNDLESIVVRVKQLVLDLFPITGEKAEMEITHVIASELLKTFNNDKDIEKGLINMFLAGQILNNI